MAGAINIGSLGLIGSIEIIFRFVVPILIIILLLFGFVMHRSFCVKNHLNRPLLCILIIGCMVNSIINIPVFFNDRFILFVNFGAIGIPIIISAYFTYKFRKYLLWILLSILTVSIVTFLLSNFEPGFGISIDFPLYFIPILIGALLVMVLFGQLPGKYRYSVIPISYSVTIFGIFIGTDVLNLPAVLVELRNAGYIGGQGVFDLVYLSGIYCLAFSLIINILISSTLKNKSRNYVRKTGIDNSKNGEMYQIAGIKPRTFAFIIDCSIQLVLIIILYSVFFSQLILALDYSSIFRGLSNSFLIGWSIILHIFYFTAFEWYSGQTPGKMLMNIRVADIRLVSKGKKNVRKDYQNVSDNRFLNMFCRNVLRTLELFLGFYLIGLIVILLSRKGQRVGDLLANTVVICC